MPQLPPRFADRLRWLMQQRRTDDGRVYSAASLSRKIKVNEKTVGNWLRDEDDSARTEPSMENLRSLCAVLGASADFMVGRTDNVYGLVPGTFVVDTAAYARRQKGEHWWASIVDTSIVATRKEFNDLRERAGLKVPEQDREGE